MVGKVLQEWLTVRGAAGQVLSQSHASYLDLSDFDDVVLYLDVREETGSPTLTFQSGISADDASLLPIAPVLTLAASSAPVVTRVLAAYSATPLARFLRWQLTSASAWDATFRITLAAYAPGV